VRQVVTRTTTERPADATHWSARAMAKAVGIAVSSAQKIWRAHGLKPHQVRTFKLSNDPNFEAKLVDIVGLYLDPPDRALVLSVDEKSQIQALDRTQPGLPLKKGRAGTMTHDYKRHGTTTLFAALNLLDGSVIGRDQARLHHPAAGDRHHGGAVGNRVHGRAGAAARHLQLADADPDPRGGGRSRRTIAEPLL